MRGEVHCGWALVRAGVQGSLEDDFRRGCGDGPGGLPARVDSLGNVIETITDPQINGPWDMTVFDQTGDKGIPGRAALFVTNVLNGTVAAGGNVVDEGTVLRIDLSVPIGSMPSATSITVIGSGFPERTDPAALAIGPTGLALSKNQQNSIRG